MPPDNTITHSTLDKEGNWQPVAVTQADTYVLMVGERSSLLRRTMWSPLDFMDLNEAVDWIGEIERGERKGIVGDLCAYKEGSYIGTIPTGHVAACIREGQQSTRDDEEHNRLLSNFGRGGL